MRPMRMPPNPLRWLRLHLGLRTVVALLIALGLFAYVVDLASRGDLGGGLGEVVGRVGLAALVLAGPFFALRALTWHLLLGLVGVRAPLRQTVAAFASGELTKSLPGGIYLETYVLARLERFGEREIVGAAVATTGMDVMVGTIGFLVAMVVGLPDEPWFRLALAGLAAAWLVAFGSAWLLVRWWRPQERVAAPRWVRATGRVVLEAADGVRRMISPAAVRPLATTALSLAILVVVFSLVAVAVGIGEIGLIGALSVVVITSLANDLLPIPMELGLTELTGVGVLAAYGISAPTAAITMLGYRVVSTGAETIVVGAALLFLRDVLSSVPRPTPQTASPS